MKIIVCIKQVPASTEVRLDPVTNNLIRDDSEGVINPYDLHAIEEGIGLKESYGAELTVISMGPPAACESLREALAMGADQAVLISDRRFAGSDTLATAYVLAKSIERLGGCDLVICGRQTIDGDTAQVGPELAQKLDFNLATNVSGVEELTKDRVKLRRMVEDGYYLLRIGLPLLITVTKEINTPRTASLKGMMRAKKAEILNLSADDIMADPEKIGIAGSPTKVKRVYKPNISRGGQIFKGDPQAAAKELFDKLKNDKIL
ncbi:MAG: electron transfer flavoprotein subunit beta/FixA family protein [Actinomycetota bacterium]|nr:electron transfer flavoprotein subunit beta/FixA family protein [Actinomycetota bacterium]